MKKVKKSKEKKDNKVVKAIRMDKDDLATAKSKYLNVAEICRQALKNAIKGNLQ